MRHIIKTPIALILVVALVIAGIGIAIKIINPPPMQGYISRKTSHPEYYPATIATPTVYCLGITSHNRQEACSWYVNEAVYNSYEVGDIVGHPSALEKIPMPE